jgi:hypothetical protein
MDALDLVAAVGKTRQPTGVYRLEAANNKPKTSDWPDASPIGATASPVVLERLIPERVQTTRRNIVFHLAVPGSGVEFGKPCPECVEFSWREPQNGFLDLIHAAHDFQRTVHRWLRTTGPRFSPAANGGERRSSNRHDKQRRVTLPVYRKAV